MKAWCVKFWFLMTIPDLMAFQWVGLDFSGIKASDSNRAVAVATQRAVRLGFVFNRDTGIEVSQEADD